MDIDEDERENRLIAATLADAMHTSFVNGRWVTMDDAGAKEYLVVASLVKNLDSTMNILTFQTIFSFPEMQISTAI